MPAQNPTQTEKDRRRRLVVETLNGPNRQVDRYQKNDAGEYMRTPPAATATPGTTGDRPAEDSPRMRMLEQLIHGDPTTGRGPVLDLNAGDRLITGQGWVDVGAENRRALYGLLPHLVGEAGANWRTDVGEQGATRRTGLTTAAQRDVAGTQAGAQRYTADQALKGNLSRDKGSVLLGALTATQPGEPPKTETQYDETTGEPTWQTRPDGSVVPHPVMIQKTAMARLQDQGPQEAANYLRSLEAAYPDDRELEQVHRRIFPALMPYLTDEQKRTFVEAMRRR